MRTAWLDVRLSNADCDAAVTGETPPWKNLELFEELGHMLHRRNLRPQRVVSALLKHRKPGGRIRYWVLGYTFLNTMYIYSHPECDAGS